MRMRAVFPGYIIVDLHINALCNQRLGNMSEEDAKREGYRCLEDFKDAWIQTHPQRGWDPVQDVWIIEWKKPS